MPTFRARSLLSILKSTSETTSSTVRLMSVLSRQVHPRELFLPPDSAVRWKVPSLFQDNFDYGDIRRDFVHGILTSDLLMKNIYCYIAKDGYAARVKDTKSYDSIRFVLTFLWLSTLLIQWSAKIYYLDGRFRSCQMTTTPVDTRMNIFVGTSTLRQMVRSYSLGGFTYLTMVLLAHNVEQNLQDREPGTHWIKKPYRRQCTDRVFRSWAALCHWSGLGHPPLVPL